MPIEPGPALVADRLVEDAEDGAAAVEQSDEGAEDGTAGDERASAVDGVEHPAVAGVGAVEAVFLAEDAMVGEAVGQHGAHGLLGGAVRDGDGALVGLGVGGQALAEEGPDDGGGDVGRGVGCSQERVQARGTVDGVMRRS